MKKDLGPGTVMFPMPVLMISTYDEKGVPDVMPAAWGGIYDSNKIGICLAYHKTTDNMKARKAFCVAFADAAHAAESDYLGLVTAKEVPDKVAKCGLHVTKSRHVDAPIVDEYPVAVECELEEMRDIGADTYYVVGKIVNVVADEKVVENGKIDERKADPITFDCSQHNYYRIGESVGKAFSMGKKFN